jgi:hypothetical protein
MVSCGNQHNNQDTEKVADTVKTGEAKVMELATDQCQSCDSIYLSFPFTDNAFSALYGWTEENTGSRYGFEDSDINELVKCLENCYSESDFNSVVELQTLLEFNADGPALLQYKLMDFYIENPDRLSSALEKLSTLELERFIRFNFAGIEKSDSFHTKLCDSLHRLKVVRADYLRMVLNECPN